MVAILRRYQDSLKQVLAKVFYLLRSVGYRFILIHKPLL